LRAPGIRRGRRAATLSARLSAHVTLEARADGNIVACFGGYSVGFGQFGAGAAAGAQELRRGLPLGSFASQRQSAEKEIHLLVRRLARHGLLEYSLGRPHGEDQVVIEPQLPDYWPQTPPLGNADVLVLSRFAYMRRRGNEMVLESPRAGALFRICSPKTAAALATLSSPHAGVMAPLPAVRPRWPGKRIHLRKFSAAQPEAISPAAKLLRTRHSTRSFDDQRPITLAELSRFLDGTARVQTRFSSSAYDGGPVVAYAPRPYPSGGGSYELELYLAVGTCEGLARGFYHYDAGGHALVSVSVRPHEFDALLRGAQFAMDTPAAPQILITIAARFGRVSWKYSSIAYALVLKDVGALMQTFYLMANDMGLGGCAIGISNIELFAKMTAIDFHIEGPVGQFAIGRGTETAPSD